MAKIQFESEEEDTENVSKPVKRMRWATQRVPKSGGVRKRVSIMNRFQKQHGSKEEKRKSAATSNTGDTDSASDAAEEEETRKILFNIPLPEEAKDEDGYPKTQFVRNKIRTAKYTPLSFVPKNLWFQFHNIANIYFLFVIILSVSFPLDIYLYLTWTELIIFFFVVR